MFSHINANTVKVDENNSYEDLPAGHYNVEIRDMGITPSKSTPVHPVFKVCYRVLNGQFEGNFIYQNLVLVKGDERDGNRIYGVLSVLRSFGVIPASQIKFVDLPTLDNLVDQIADMAIGSYGFTLELSYREYTSNTGEKRSFPNFKIKKSFSLNEIPPAQPVAYQSQVASFAPQQTAPMPQVQVQTQPQFQPQPVAQAQVQPQAFGNLAPQNQQLPQGQAMFNPVQTPVAQPQQFTNQAQPQPVATQGFAQTVVDVPF